MNAIGDDKTRGAAVEHGRSEAPIGDVVTRPPAPSASLSPSWRDRERLRIAQQLRDQLGEALSSLRSNIETVRATGAAPVDAQGAGRLQQRLDSMLTVVNGTIDAVRNMAPEARRCGSHDL